jgi:Protein of unknown function (DUF3237)
MSAKDDGGGGPLELDRRRFFEIAIAMAAADCASPSPRVAAAGLESSTKRDNAMRTRPLFTLRLGTAPTLDIGDTPHGPRVTFPVTGGTFEGDRLRGKVLPGGDDWTIRRADGVFELDLRVTLETDDGALIHMTFEGIRDDAAPYFRTLPRFETGAPKYAFLNKLLAVGRGEATPEGPVHVLEEVL